MLVVTHYQRLLELHRARLVHVMADGRIVRPAARSSRDELEAEGYALDRTAGGRERRADRGQRERP